MKSSIYIIFILIGLVISATAQTAFVRVEVEGGTTLELNPEALSKLTRREIKGKAHDGKKSLFSGYLVSDILLAADAKVGTGKLRGKELAAYLLVEGADGYKAVFAIAEFSSEFSERPILLADKRDGKALDAKDGPWQIIVPDDKRHGRWVRQVIVLKVKKAN